MDRLRDVTFDDTTTIAQSPWLKDTTVPVYPLRLFFKDIISYHHVIRNLIVYMEIRNLIVYMEIRKIYIKCRKNYERKEKCVKSCKKKSFPFGLSENLFSDLVYVVDSLQHYKSISPWLFYRKYVLLHIFKTRH